MNRPPGYNPVLARYEDAVQAAQTAYCDEMATYWQWVIAGELAEADYWQIADAGPYARCRAAIGTATREYDAARGGR